MLLAQPKAKHEEIVGVLVEIRRPPNCGDFFLGKVRPIEDGEPSRSKTISIVGNAEEDDLKLQMTYRWYGKWDKHEKFGDQLKIDTFVPARPHGKIGTVKYLQESPHIGEATATQLWNLFQSDAVRICREHPEIVASKVPRLSVEKCEEIAEHLAALQSLESTSIDLLELLAGRGFPKAIARQVVKRWGNKAPQIIGKDPFRLMAFRGCGFLKCDSMYTDLGLPPAKLKRQVCAAWYSIASDNDGHVWHGEAKVGQFLKSKIGGVQVQPDKAIGIAKRARAIDTRRHCPKCSGSGRTLVPDLFTGKSLVEGPCPQCKGTGGALWLAEWRLARAEEYVAQHIAQAELETQPQAILQFADEVTRHVEIPESTRCTRCHRKLTAAEVAILDDKPYGPDCITKVPGGASADRVPLEEWLERHPVVVERRHERLVGEAELQFFNGWPSPDELDGIDDHQREKYAEATTGRIGILGGGPGTGKTTVAAAVVRALIKRYGMLQVAVAAPTGKAAVRTTEAMQEREIPIKAMTIHRLLGVESNDEGEGWVFKHRESNPLPYRFIIIDEPSMIDLPLWCSLLKARARGTHILFCGDVNQLPPVGPGAPLRDLIAAGVSYGELTKVHRNGGTIVQACDAIKNCRPIPLDQKIELDRVCPRCEEGAVEYGAVCPQCNGDYKLPPRNLQLITTTQSNAIRALDDLIASLRKEGIDPVWDTQIIVAVNKRSPLGRKAINQHLQDLLNPNGVSVQGSPFRVNDKVINLKNAFYKRAESEFSDEQEFIANGDMGRVISVELRQTVIEFLNPKRRVRVSRIPEKPAKGNDKGEEKEGKEDEATGTGCDIDLAYACTCHKFQGSQAPVVVVMLDEYAGATGPYGVATREWAFTAISRAQKRTYLIGKRETLDRVCKRTALTKRKTFLREQIEAFRSSLSPSSPSPSRMRCEPCSETTSPAISESATPPPQAPRLPPAMQLPRVPAMSPAKPAIPTFAPAHSD